MASRPPRSSAAMVASGVSSAAPAISSGAADVQRLSARRTHGEAAIERARLEPAGLPRLREQCLRPRQRHAGEVDDGVVGSRGLPMQCQRRTARATTPRRCWRCAGRPTAAAARRGHCAAHRRNASRRRRAVAGTASAGWRNDSQGPVRPRCARSGPGCRAWPALASRVAPRRPPGWRPRS